MKKSAQLGSSQVLKLTFFCEVHFNTRNLIREAGLLLRWIRCFEFKPTMYGKARRGKSLKTRRWESDSITKKKKKPQTMISLRNYYGRTVWTLTVNSGLHVTCIPLMASPPLTPSVHRHSLHFHLQNKKETTRSIWKLICMSICPAFDPVGQKGKVRRGGRKYTLVVPSR